MMNFLPQCVINSLAITAIFNAFREGNVLSPVREWVANKMDSYLNPVASRIIQKPLWDCLPCMASVWTCALTWSFDIPIIIVVSGINVIIESAILSDDR